MLIRHAPQSPPAPRHHCDTSSSVRAPQRTASTTSRSATPRHRHKIMVGPYSILIIVFKYVGRHIRTPLRTRDSGRDSARLLHLACFGVTAGPNAFVNT